MFEKDLNKKEAGAGPFKKVRSTGKKTYFSNKNKAKIKKIFKFRKKRIIR